MSFFSSISFLPKTRKLIFLIIFATTLSNGQSEKEVDSLINWSYDELYQNFKKSTNTEESIKFSSTYLLKAKSQSDTIRIARGYTQMASLNVNNPDKQDFNKAITYIDSIIYLTSPNYNFEYPGFAYLYKGLIQFHLGDYNNCLNNYSIAYKLALINKNEDHLFKLNENIAQIKLFWGDAKDAIQAYKNQLNLLVLNEKLSTYNNRLNLFFNLSNAYLINKQIDSAEIFNKIGLISSLNEEDGNYHYPLYLHQSGEILFQKNQLVQAKDSLLKSLKIETPEIKSANTYNILGQIAAYSKDTLQAINYFLTADQILEETEDFTSETKNIYSFLKDYYLVNGDRKNSNLYSNKLKKTDSILTANYKMVNRRLIEDFEIPKLIIEKNDAVNTVEDKSRYKDYTNKAIVLIATILLVGAFVYVQRKRLFEIKKEDPLKEMNPELVNKILDQLDNFEKKKTFTNKKYNLKTIAVKFQTNSAYLSKVINAKKNKNVSSYLSDLRINNCINELKTNKLYHNYDVQSLAHEFGFNNAGSFTKAFSTKTGTTPAAYIKKFK